MAEVLTWFCACLHGRGPAGNRPLTALGCAQRDNGPRAMPAETAVGRGQDGGVMAGRGVMGQAKRGELKRAARQLGVTSAILRQHGWKTASPARVKAAAIDARWAPEVRRAMREARQLASELTPERVRARIGRERDAAFEAARYRAGQLLRRALEG
jgi:hypothetical protein